MKKIYYEGKREKQSRNLITFIAMVIIIALLMMLNLRLEGIQMQEKSPEYSTEKLSTVVEEKEKEEEKTNYDFIEKATKSIVGISKMKKSISELLGITEAENTFGSGVLITDNGYILTNYHITGNKYSNCYVTLEDGKIYDGQVVWVDKNIDLAIVKISISKSDYMVLGDSDNISLGEDVYAIREPYRF